jgi:heme exporter protein D
VYSDGEITWEIENNLSLSPNQSKEFTYTLEVPKVSFGTYDNSVTAYPVQGDNFSAQRSVDLTCDIDQPTTVPQTGLFDTVLGRVSVGVSFIFVGGLVSQYSRLNYFFNSISQRHEFKKEIKRQRRKEERMAKRRKKLENRFK